MLVLSRKENQVIYIGEGPNRITLTIVECRPGRVRLGIEAPGCAVVRGEIAQPTAKAEAK